MKITKRQLRRIIREQVGPKKIEYQSPEWHEAMDVLIESLVNAASDAVDAGLLEDDLKDAWRDALNHVTDVLLDPEGGY